MTRLLVLAAALFTATPALASPDDTPPTWGFSFRTGPYQPSMGANAAYYKAYYADGSGGSLFKNRPLMSELEIDWYLLRSFGLLGPMLQLGLWNASGNTRSCTDATTGEKGVCPAAVIAAGNSTKESDHTQLSAYPVGLGVVYKLDLIKRYTIVPLVPYAKGAMQYFFWRNTVGGSISHYNGKPAEGGTLGARVTVGLALNLDFIEPGAASRARTTTGLADSYLFGEYSRLWVDGFGNKKRLDFSGQVIQVGIAVDFQ